MLEKTDKFRLGRFIGRLSRPSGAYNIAYGTKVVGNEAIYTFILLRSGEIALEASTDEQIWEAAVDNFGNFALSFWFSDHAARTNESLINFYRLDGEEFARLSFAPGVDLYGLYQNGDSVLLGVGSKIVWRMIEPNVEKLSFQPPKRFHVTAADLSTDGFVLLWDCDHGPYRFTAEGEFVDYKEWQGAFLESASGEDIYYLLEEICRTTDGWCEDEYANAARWIEIALERGIEESYTTKKEKVFRLLARLRQGAGNVDGSKEAIELSEEWSDGFRVIDGLSRSLEGLLGNGDSAELSEALRNLERAELYPRLSDSPSYYGRLFRYRGEILAALSRKSEAIAAFQRALEIDPKVGCKRKLAILRK